MKLKVLPNPCASCPYATSTPSGVWAPEEYAKLPGFDTNERLGTFLCHQTNATGELTVCRGWLSVHRDSVAVRLAVARGEVTAEEAYEECSVPLYGSGGEAAVAGLRGIRRPGPAARRMAARLLRSRAAKP